MSFLAPALRRPIRPAVAPAQYSICRSLSSYTDSRILPYTQKELYRVVADVDAYSSFIPFLLSSKVLHQPLHAPKKWLDGPEGETLSLEAELSVGFAGWSERYISKTTFEKFHTVKAEANAPDLFKHLSTTWKLTPHPLRTIAAGKETIKELTRVDYELHYEFSNPLYALAASSKFDSVASKVLKGFEKRCHELYGTKKNTDMIMNTIIDQGEDAVNILRHLNGVFTKGNWSSFFGGCQDLENKTQAL